MEREKNYYELLASLHYEVFLIMKKRQIYCQPCDLQWISIFQPLGQESEKNYDALWESFELDMLLMYAELARLTMPIGQKSPELSCLHCKSNERHLFVSRKILHIKFHLWSLIVFWKDTLGMNFCLYYTNFSGWAPDLSAPLFVCHIVVLVSSLSGNQGSWTNTDDHKDDSAKAINDANKRKHKEAKNKMIHGSQTPHKPKTDLNQQCRQFANGLCSRAAKCRFLHLLDDDRSLSSTNTISNESVPIIPPVQPTSFKKVGYKYTNIVDLFLFYDNDLFVEVSPCDRHMYNFEELVFERVFIPEFNSLGRTFQSRNANLNVLFTQSLLANLRVLPDEARNYVAVFSLLISKFRFFPRHISDDHAVYYIYRNSFIANPSATMQLSLNHRIPTNSGMVRQLPLLESPSPSYVFNKRWNFSCHDACFMVNIDNEIVVYPTFDHSNAVKMFAPSSLNAFSQFSPGNMFCVYANSTTNIQAAMSRLLKCRGTYENEVAYTQRQYVNLIGLSDSVLSDVASFCKCDYSLGVLTSRPGYSHHLDTPNGAKKRTTRHEHRIPPLVNQRHVLVKDVIHKLIPLNIYECIYQFIIYWLCKVGEFAILAVSFLATPVRYLQDPKLVVETLASLRHVKLQLYQLYVKDPGILNKIVVNEGDFESKFKYENGKYGKPGRLYATGQWLALVDPITPMFLKFIFKKLVLIGYIPYNGVDVPFYLLFSDSQAPVDSDLMYNQVVELLQSDGFIYVMFSDDGFFLQVLNQRMSIVETDIASCDASNGFPVFALVYYMATLVGFEHSMAQLLRQCSRPTIIKNPTASGWFKLWPVFFFEYSGSVLTTILNNVASMCIAVGIYNLLLDNPEASPIDACVQGASSCGWEITAVERSSMNALTFLKRAYNGKRSWICYGTILRGLGIVKGDLCKEQFGLSKQEFAKLDKKQLFEILLKQTVDGLVNEPASPLINALRERVGYPTTPFVVTYRDLEDRYAAPEWLWPPLISLVSTLKLGDICSLPVLDLIFKVDYGVSTVEELSYEDQHARAKKIDQIF